MIDKEHSQAATLLGGSRQQTFHTLLPQTFGKISLETARRNLFWPYLFAAGLLVLHSDLGGGRHHRVAQTVKNLPAVQETWVHFLGRADRSPGEGNGNPLRYFCLENPMDRGAWWAPVHGVTKSQDTTE